MSTVDPAPSVGPGPDPLSPQEARAQLELAQSRVVVPPGDARVHGLVSILSGILMGIFAVASVWLDHRLIWLCVAGLVLIALVIPLGVWAARTHGMPRHARRPLRIAGVLGGPALILGPQVLHAVGLTHSWPTACLMFLLVATPFVVAGVLVLRRGSR